MTVTITNTNFRTSLKTPIDLERFYQLLPSSKLFIKPRQLVIKDDIGVLVFFSNGKMRIMGCNDDFDATMLAYKYIALVANETPEIQLQSMTVKVATAKRINLAELHQLIIPSTLELELFPALMIQKYKPISVNVFATGNIIFCGIKKIEDVEHIMNKISNFI